MNIVNKVNFNKNYLSFYISNMGLCIVFVVIVIIFYIIEVEERIF